MSIKTIDIDLSNIGSCAINLLNMWMFMGLLCGISLIHTNLYYSVLFLLTVLLIYDRWMDMTKAYINKVHLLVDVLSILWVLGHVFIHVNTCYTSELLRSNMWLDIIFHQASAILSLATFHYDYDQRKKAEMKQSTRQYTVEYYLTFTYLMFINLSTLLAVYMSIKYIQTPEDGDHLANWFIGPALSVFNFSTINVYHEKIFSQRFIFELFHGLLIFIVQVSHPMSIDAFVVGKLYETYLFAALICSKYEYIIQYIKAPQKTLF
jgi:hypothetical protein